MGTRKRLKLAEDKLAEISLLHVEEAVPENEFNQGFEMRWCAYDHGAWPCRHRKIIDS
jgi:hypothetical protein